MSTATAQEHTQLSLRPRSKPSSPVLAWRTPLAVQFETINAHDSTLV